MGKRKYQSRSRSHSRSHSKKIKINHKHNRYSSSDEEHGSKENKLGEKLHKLKISPTISSRKDREYNRTSSSDEEHRKEKKEKSSRNRSSSPL